MLFLQSSVRSSEKARLRRQADKTEAPERSGGPVELLVEQPKTGASLGEILGESWHGWIINFSLFCRSCFTGYSCLLHLWNQLEAV